jgi:hypothetical protein
MARDVVHVAVDGALLVRAGEHQRYDPSEVAARARSEARKVTLRAGL